MIGAGGANNSLIFRAVSAAGGCKPSEACRQGPLRLGREVRDGADGTQGSEYFGIEERFVERIACVPRDHRFGLGVDPERDGCIVGGGR